MSAESVEVARNAMVKRINPDGMHKNPAFTQVIEVSGPHRTIYVGGQNSVDEQGNIVGKGDIAKQAEQAVRNLQSALRAVGADLEDMVKCTIYIVQGQPLQPGFQAYMQAWGDRQGPPTVSSMFVAGLANPDYLLEIDAIAVLP